MTDVLLALITFGTSSQNTFTFTPESGVKIVSGLLGADTFFFDNSGTASTWNVKLNAIIDFGTGGRNTAANSGDVLQFSHADLAALTGYANASLAYTIPTGSGSTTLTADSNIAQGAGVITATGTDTQFIYNSTTGAVYYDADGSGSGAAVQVAIIATGLTLTATDFLIVA